MSRWRQAPSPQTPARSTCTPETHPCGAQPIGDRPALLRQLDINPKDGALLIASHTGLYRARGAQAPRRIGDYQDTMAFEVIGPDHFLGSGHPDVRAGLPAYLGLIESRDGGRTWKPRSLQGKVVRIARRR